MKKTEFSIYNFFTSRDVAEYCVKMGKTFNTFEMFLIIEKSKKTENEKMEAYNILLNEFPDMPLDERIGELNFKTAHEYIRQRIKWMETVSNDFFTPNKKMREEFTVSVYSFEQFKVLPQTNLFCENFYDEMTKRECNAKKSKHPLARKFNSAIEFLEEAKQYWNDDIKSIRIIKTIYEKQTNKSKVKKIGSYYVDINRKGELTHEEVFLQREFGKYFGLINPVMSACIFIHIPTPFNNGDIVSFNGRPRVLVDIASQRRSYDKSLSGLIYPKEFRDDITFYSEIDEHTGKVRYSERIGIYEYQAEYWRGELIGKNKLLVKLSEEIKLRTLNAD